VSQSPCRFVTYSTAFSRYPGSSIALLSPPSVHQWRRPALRATGVVNPARSDRQREPHSFNSSLAFSPSQSHVAADVHGVENPIADVAVLADR
jgi:hypothetical protein